MHACLVGAGMVIDAVGVLADSRLGNCGLDGTGRGFSVSDRYGLGLGDANILGILGCRLQNH